MYIYGTSSRDNLIGTDGNDYLDGLAGIDTLRGGKGDDTYVVDNRLDQLVENAGEGWDRVIASVNYTLSENVEALYLTGNATEGRGNSGDNLLVGNETLGSILEGQEGNDFMYGGAGDDALIGDAGNDYLDGRAGSNYLAGGTGSDTYIVNSLNDEVVEQAGAGWDHVISYANDYTLADNVENLFLAGNATVGTGNSGDNFLVANQSLGSTLNGKEGNDYLFGGAGDDILNGDAGNDYLDGGAGNNFLAGGAGNDTYVVSSFGDKVVEAPGEGVDSVILTQQLFDPDVHLHDIEEDRPYVLADNVENLYLGGNATQASGNSGDNYLVANQILGSSLSGGDGNDVIIGGAGDDGLVGNSGNDTLTGGAGSDLFAFASDGFPFPFDAPVGSFADMGVDTITDFTSGQDKLFLLSFTFQGLTLDNFVFASVTSDQQAATSEANIVYNSTNGSLSYNQDAVTDGFGSGGQFATLSPNLALTANDFLIDGWPVGMNVA
jgi:Ca2+-binding RTX toxin-like protein